MMFGGGGGGGFGGPGGAAASAASGLPFAGIPSELQDGVDKLLATEPEYAEPDIVFTQNGSEAELKRLSLWRLLTKYPGMLTLAGLLVVVVAVASQVGTQAHRVRHQQRDDPGSLQLRRGGGRMPSPTWSSSSSPPWPSGSRSRSPAGWPPGS